MTLSSLGVDLLVFQVGEEFYGVDAKQIIRIDDAPGEVVELPSLGPVRSRGKGLVFQSPSGQKKLKVDTVRGLETALADDLRKLPPIVSAAPWAVGLWLRANKVVLLIDLEKV